MWQRFKRLLRSIFGGWVSSMEDPVLILEQNIRDMRDKIPKMNENIALIKANVTLLEKEIAKLSEEEKILISNIKAGIQAGRDDIAAGYAATLESVKAAKIRSEGQLKTAKAAYEKAEDVKKAFLKELDKKTKEAMLAIQEAKRAKWQKEVADVMESFEVGGIDQTHDEMIRKIEQENAVSEARMDLALGKVDSEKMRIEEEAEKIRAAELVKQFKIEMGIIPSAPVPVSTEQVKTAEPQREQV